MLFAPVGCPTCQRTEVVQDGHTPERKPRFHGRHLAGQRPAFRLEYPQKGLLPEVNTQIVARARQWQSRYGTCVERESDDRAGDVHKKHQRCHTGMRRS